jgi:hypothetical protein
MHLSTHSSDKTRFIRRYIDTGNISSTSNLHRHAIRCWGDEAVAAADKTCTAKVVREALSNREVNGSITAAFERVGKGKVTYSTRQHTKLEARYILFLFHRCKISDTIECSRANSSAG